MKKLILLCATLITIASNAQDNPVELNCYNKWAAKFEERGAEPVADGVYTDVIIARREGAKATCNNGKVEVKGGQVVKMYLALDNGTYEEVVRTWKDKNETGALVVNGISSGRITIHNEIFSVIFYKKLKPKKAKPTAAPEPTDD